MFYFRIYIGWSAELTNKCKDNKKNIFRFYYLIINVFKVEVIQFYHVFQKKLWNLIKMLKCWIDFFFIDVIFCVLWSHDRRALFGLFSFLILL